MDKIDIENFPNKKHPGVSGKQKDKSSWINLSTLKKQHEFLQERAKSGATDEAMSGFESAGRGNNLIGRSDLKDQQESDSKQKENNPDKKLHESIKVALQRNPETDLSNITITVTNGDAAIKGLVSDAKEKRAIEAITQNIPGVGKVFNHLEVDPNESVTQKEP